MAKTYDKRQCEDEQCRKKFTPKRPWQKFCSPVCRWNKWERENPRIKKAVKP